jgi:ketosteroid isomerase-like protein
MDERMTPFFRHSLGQRSPGHGLGTRHLLGLGILALAWLPAPGLAQDPTAELDAFWAEVSRTVAEGDFEGYAAAYHEDAILVSGIAGTSYPISQALAGWRQGFLDTRAGTMEASVEFRFTQRLSDETTAHETGIFHYQAVDAEGNPTGQFIHFEALLIRKDGWKIMMEYQKSVATQEEWNAAGGEG